TVLLIRVLPREARTAVPIREARQWLASALPMSLTEGMRVAQGHAATLLLGALSSSAQVGIFKVADSAAALCALPVTLMNVTAAPIVARLVAEGNHGRLRRLAGLS